MIIKCSAEEDPQSVHHFRCSTLVLAIIRKAKGNDYPVRKPISHMSKSTGSLSGPLLFSLPTEIREGGGGRGEGRRERDRQKRKR